MVFIPYSRQHIDENDINEVVKVLRSAWITQGPKIEEFEEAICRYTGAKYAVAVSSGTAALHIACLASGLKEGDEAITSPITFLATSNSVIYTGAKPVFADVRADTVNLDPLEVAKKCSDNTKAILPVHFAGLPCNMKEISEIARKNNLIVIEDASHALGAEYKHDGEWKKIGSCTHSDMTVLSFHPVKHITTGEGGAVLTNRKDIYERCMTLRTHGVVKEKKNFHNSEEIIVNSGDWYYEMQMLGFNYRITDIQCALGISQLKKLDKFIESRRKVVEQYEKFLSGCEEIELPKNFEEYRSAWHLYTIRLKDANKRKTVFEALRKKDIGVQVHYIPVPMQPYYRERYGYKKGMFIAAEDYYKRAISLPIYPQIKQAEVEYVAETLKGILK